MTVTAGRQVVIVTPGGQGGVTVTAPTGLPGQPGPPGPPGPPGSGGGGGGGGAATGEIYLGPDTPPSVTQVLGTVLWVDTDDPGVMITDPGTLAYTYVQTTPAEVWVIDHPLEFPPNITVVDTQGDQVEGEVAYTSVTTITVRFSAAFAGQAYLS